LAASGSKVGLLDADIYGPSVPIMFDLQNERPFLRQVEGRDKMLPFERYGVKLMSIGFLVEANQPVVWRGPMASKAINQLIGDTIWEEIDYLIVDLPPGTGDIHITIAQQFPLTGAVIVTTPQAVAVADARKAAAMFVSSHIQVPILGIVENMAYFSPPNHPTEKYYIFGEGGGQALAAEFEVPLLGSIPIVEAVRTSGDLGTPFVFSHSDPIGTAFQNIAQETARRVSILNTQMVPTAG
jgi:ATP-binding protein involved in chromosome partitioning